MFNPTRGSPFNRANSTTNVSIVIEPLSKDYAEKVQNKLNPLKASVSEQHFNIKNHTIPAHFTVRSPILNITTYGRADDGEYFGGTVTMTIVYNPISNEKGLLASKDEAAVASTLTIEGDMFRESLRRDHRRGSSALAMCLAQNPQLQRIADSGLFKGGANRLRDPGPWGLRRDLPAELCRAGLSR